MNIKSKVSLKDYFEEAIGLDLSSLAAIRIEALGGGDSGQIENIEAIFTTDYVVTETEQIEIEKAVVGFVNEHNDSFIQMAGGNSFNWYDNEGGGLSIHFDLKNDTIERRGYYNTEETVALPAVRSQPIPESIRELIGSICTPVFAVVIADANFYDGDLLFCDEDAQNTDVEQLAPWQCSSQTPLDEQSKETLADLLDGIETTQEGVSDCYCDESGWFKVYRLDTQAGTMDMCLNYIDRGEQYEIDEVLNLSNLEDLPGNDLLATGVLAIH